MLLATRGAEEIVSNTQRHVRLWLRARRQKKHAAGRIQELARKRSTVRRARRPADRLAACCKLQSLTRGQLARAQLRRNKARFAAARLREEKLKETTALIRLTNDEEKETWARLGSELVTLARTYDYSLRSDDLLELTNNDTVLGLATVIGVLEDGIEEQTEVCKTRGAAAGQVAQWEQRTVARCHEKPLVLQLCRLLRGFTLPATYFNFLHTYQP